MGKLESNLEFRVRVLREGRRDLGGAKKGRGLLVLCRYGIWKPVLYVTEKYPVLEQMRKEVVSAADLLIREGGTAIEDHKIMAEFEDMGSNARKELILVDFQVVD